MSNRFQCSGCEMWFTYVEELKIHQSNYCIDKWDEINIESKKEKK